MYVCVDLLPARMSRIISRYTQFAACFSAVTKDRAVSWARS